MNPNHVDWDQLKEEVGEILSDTLEELVDGAQADLKAFGAAIASDMIEAAQLGDQEILDELKAQAGVLAQAQGLRARGAGWEAVGKVVLAVTNTVIQTLGSIA